MVHILLITSSNLASNPRCLKELQLLDSMNVKISVVGFKFHNWADKNEIRINKDFKDVTFFYLDSTRHEIVSWIFLTLMEKLCRLLKRFFPKNLFFSAMALTKKSWLLLRWMKKWNGHPNLIIAHNPPTFYPAFFLSKKIKAPFAIDIEDFHPGEGRNKQAQKNIIMLMKCVLPKAVYISYASPLIEEFTNKLFGQKNFLNFTINNCFPNNEFKSPDENFQNHGKLRFVWFSQYINYSRGLENFLPVFDIFSDNIDLTLIGEMRQNFYIQEIKHRKYINYQPSLSQSDLHASLSMFDVGLAVENKLVDTNKNICLSNKIWAYFQSGLFILASDTDGQRSFLMQHHEHGILIPLEQKVIKKTLEHLIQNVDMIRSGRFHRYKAAKKFSWEIESKVLNNKWQAILEPLYKMNIAID